MNEDVCKIELLGDVRIVCGTEAIDRFRTQKASGLVAYLALSPRRSVAREALADLFWPDKDPEAGRQNLTTTLTTLRRQLEALGLPADDVLIADRLSVRLNPERVRTDVEAFDRALGDAAKATEPARRAEALEAAVALYRAEPLPGRYEDWALEFQRRYAERYADALDQLCAALEALGRTEAALATAQRAVAADPYREAPRGALMRAYAALGRTAAALEAFSQYEALLRDTLGTTPSDAIQAQAERLRQNPAPPVRASLPAQLTRFFGREQELERLEALLSPGGVRLVTVTGPGGAGKTRLAVEAGQRLEGAFAGRVWFVELAPLPDPEFLPATVANALELPVGDDPLQAVAVALRDRPSLLILDNFEHLLRPAPHEPGKGAEYVRQLLERAPQLVCLVSSRQPLHLGGEQEFPVPRLVQSASAALFLDRAALARPDFALTERNAAPVAELCRRLEGMPLAIEMAAAWVKSLPPAQILERMERQLDLLVSRRRDLPARHQSLRAAIEWSYALLAPAQRRFLTRLSVFQGGWSLDAAAAVGACDEAEALEALTELQERSLVEVVQSDERVRYRLPESVREFCQERLDDAGERAEIARRHRDFYLGLAEASEALVAAGRTDLLPRLEEERDNLRAAIRFCGDDPDSGEIGLRFPVAMHHYWESRGFLAEGLRLCLALLAHPGAQARTEARAYVLQTCFWMAFYQSDYARGILWIEESLAIMREAGGLAGLGNVLNALGAARMVQHEMERAQACFEESCAIWRQLGDLPKICRALHNLGRAISERGDSVRARQLFEEALSLNRQLGSRGGEAATLQYLSRMDLEAGDLAQARRRGEAALRLNREIGNRTWEVFALSNLAWVAQREGKADEAQGYCLESLGLYAEVGSKKDLASMLECLTELAHGRGLWERTATLAGAASALRAAIGRPGGPLDPQAYAAKLEEARDALGAPSFQGCWDEGARLPIERAISFAQSVRG